MKDNLGNDINAGDLVFCYSGIKKNTIQKVRGFRVFNGEPLNGVTEAVNFEGKEWVSALNVVSLNALGVNGLLLPISKPAKGCDALGNQLNIGDKVLFLHSMEMYTEVGVVKSMTEKSCLLTIKPNRFGQNEYRKNLMNLFH